MNHPKSPSFPEFARRIRRVTAPLGRTLLVQPGPHGSAFTGCTIETGAGPHKLFVTTGGSGTVSLTLTMDPVTAWRLMNAYSTLISTEQTA